MASIAASQARAARIAVNVLFFANGAASASILPRLPAIKDGLGLTNAELGAAVAAMPVGGLLAGGLVGVLIARFGSGRLAAVAALGDALAVALLGLSSSWLALVAAYFVMGVFDATMDASMNTHGVGVERQYGRSILQGFHGGWSAGCMVAGTLGAAAAAAGIPVSVHLAVVGLVLAVAILATARGLLPAAVADVRDVAADGIPIDVRAADTPRLLRMLLPIAMLGILCVVVQTSAATWSAVFGADVLHLDVGLAALGYVAYAAAMTASRLVNDRWVDRLGLRRMVRVGAAISAASLLAVIASAPLHAPVLAFAGFAGVGVGTSPMFPAMVATAGSQPGLPSGYGVALTSWMVRVGLIVAPATIGWAADGVGLAAAMWIPVVAAGVIWVMSPLMTASAVRRTSVPPAAAVPQASSISSPDG